jgi:hypothetical protein
MLGPATSQSDPDAIEKSVGVVGHCQDLVDVDLKLLTLSIAVPIYLKQGMFTPLLSEVNNQLLCFADIEAVVVVLARQCQFTYLLYRLTSRFWLSGPQPWCHLQT